MGTAADNDRVLENWGKRFQVSPRNVFRLIAHVGEDCAGAVQFVRPERLEALQTDTASKEVKWLTEDDVAERLRALRADHSAWRSAQDTGQFSLAGAQPKTALLFERKRWGVPLVAFQLRIFSNRPRVNGMVTRRMSTSRCNWPGPLG